MKRETCEKCGKEKILAHGMKYITNDPENYEHIDEDFYVCPNCFEKEMTKTPTTMKTIQEYKCSECGISVDKIGREIENPSDPFRHNPQKPMKTILEIEKRFDRHFPQDDRNEIRQYDPERNHVGDDLADDIKRFYRTKLSEILDSLMMEEAKKPPPLKGKFADRTIDALNLGGASGWNECQTELLSRINKIKEGL